MLDTAELESACAERTTYETSPSQSTIFIVSIVIRITLGLGNRSIFHPYSSVGDTFTFDVDGRTRVRNSLRTFLSQKRLRVRPLKHISLVPQVLKMTRVGQRTAVDGTDAPNIPPLRERGERVMKVTLGWVIDRSFTPITQ